MIDRVFFFLLFTINFFHAGDGRHYRIIGGRQASTEEFPYQVELELMDSHACGGSIIDEKHVVTAAHCVEFNKYLEPVPSFILRARVGADQSGQGGTIYEVNKIIVHENYKSDIKADQYDIALLEMKTPIKFTDKVKPIKMVTREPEEGEDCWVTGYGRQEVMRRARTSIHLKVVELPIITLANCRKMLKNVADDMICAGGNLEKRDACVGDSGGPLVTKKGLAGIVAWGIGCGRKGNPGVYTSIAYYQKWIKQKIKMD